MTLWGRRWRVVWVCWVVVVLVRFSRYLLVFLFFRLDGFLFSGVRVEGDILGFFLLTFEYSGVYVCYVSNEFFLRDF